MIPYVHIETSLAFTATLIAAGAALLGALGSQLITGLIGLKSKRLELYFRAKGDAYTKVMDCLGDFALNPTSQTTYLKFLAATDAALLFASDEVLSALNDNQGINVNAGRLRQSAAAGGVGGIPTVVHVQVTTWKDSVDRLTAAMRLDLRRTAGTK